MQSCTHPGRSRPACHIWRSRGIWFLVALIASCGSPTRLAMNDCPMPTGAGSAVIQLGGSPRVSEEFGAGMHEFMVSFTERLPRVSPEDPEFLRVAFGALEATLVERSTREGKDEDKARLTARVLFTQILSEEQAHNGRLGRLSAFGDSLRELPGVALGIQRAQERVQLASARREARRIASGHPRGGMISALTAPDSADIVVAVEDISEAAADTNSSLASNQAASTTSRTSHQGYFQSDTAWQRELSDYDAVMDSTVLGLDWAIFDAWLLSEGTLEPAFDVSGLRCNDYEQLTPIVANTVECWWCLLLRAAAALATGAAGNIVMERIQKGAPLTTPEVKSAAVWGAGATVAGWSLAGAVRGSIIIGKAAGNYAANEITNMLEVWLNF